MHFRDSYDSLRLEHALTFREKKGFCVPVCGYLMRVLRIFWLLLMQRYENENLNTIVLFLLSSVSRFLVRYFCDCSPIWGNTALRYSALISLNFARRDEMPGCGLQLLNFIRYCPSSRARGSFCGWVFCVWVAFQSGYHARVRVCNLLLSLWGRRCNCFLPYSRKTADHADAAWRLRNASLSLAGSRPAVAAALELLPGFTDRKSVV